MTRSLWKQMIETSVPFPVPDHALETLYHRAAAAWGNGQSLYLGSKPFETDLTKLFEQYRMLEILKNKEPDHDRIDTQDC
jgi:hypothetical protein